jgi:hypothetical protein
LTHCKTQAERRRHHFFDFKLLRLFGLLLSALILLTPLFGFLAAEFPDDAALAKFAIKAGVRAGPTKVQAFLAVSQFMLLAVDARFPVRVKTAFIHKIIISKTAWPPRFLL